MAKQRSVRERRARKRDERDRCEGCRRELSKAGMSEPEAIEAELDSAAENKQVVWCAAMSVRSLSQPSAATCSEPLCCADEQERQEHAQQECARQERCSREQCRGELGKAGTSESEAIEAEVH